MARRTASNPTSAIRVARDTRPAPPRVKSAATRAIKRAHASTVAIKAKRAR